MRLQNANANAHMTYDVGTTRYNRLVGYRPVDSNNNDVYLQPVGSTSY